jgi:tetratricopeptide (TPR) repeat protein
VRGLISILSNFGNRSQVPLHLRPKGLPHKENEVSEVPSINPVGNPSSKGLGDFNLSDYRDFHTLECLASFAWKQMRNLSPSITEMRKYLYGPCSCLQNQGRSEAPGFTYEELAADALHDLQKGNLVKAQTFFSKAAARKEEEAKKAFQKAAEALRHQAALMWVTDPGEAVALYRRATELDPNNANGWVLLRTLLHQLGFKEQAEDVGRRINENRKEDH